MKSFTKIIVDCGDLFSTLSKGVQFEDVIKGRKGAVLIDVKDGLIPLVRTTSKYEIPAQRFQDIHYNIITKIKEESKIDTQFNNALIEIYDDRYFKMGFHSDQAQDLMDDSYIAIYSCYKNKPTDNNLRTVIIKNKRTKGSSVITMEHNSVILFSLSTNSQHLHKIVLNNDGQDNQWLGITFRMSKTFIRHVNNVPYLYTAGPVLKMANEEERKIFYKLRGRENKKIEFEYPGLNFTISPSDMLPVT